jgi:hypothetical protein
MADLLDIFNQDAFRVTTMAQAMREIKYVPSYLSSLGIFRETYIDTVDIVIEKDADQQIFIVPSSPRGAPGVTFGKGRRQMRKLAAPHYQVDDAIYADEVQAARAMGDPIAVETLIGKITRRAGEVSQSFALTEERQKLAVVTKGLLLDADGTTMYDYYAEFGETMPTEIAFDLANVSPARGALRKLCAALVRQMGTTLDGIPFSGIMALCSDSFFDAFSVHPEVTGPYQNWAAAVNLQQPLIGNGQVGGIWGAFKMFDIYWVNYRGGQTVGIPTDKAYFIPLGTPDLFRSVYVPADYMETVNTLGQRLYSKVWRMDNDKGMNMEFQSNVLHYCVRPRCIFSARLGS